jgi:general stress protein 26
MTTDDLLTYVRRHRLAVVATTAADGAPHAALFGIASTDRLELVFDTVASKQTHANLLRDRRVAVVFAGPDEQTLQYEGLAHPVSPVDAVDAPYMAAYLDAWPEGRARLRWPDIAYWRVAPGWARYADYARGPLIVPFEWPNRAGGI